ncbi:MAG: exodeoxyribonuclease VII large subunit [Clostridia bacterium]|nr:exodeoxyribonuclease VII large subunit [Clostridia bacterium]
MEYSLQLLKKTMNNNTPLSVKQLNTYIKSLFESDMHLINVTVIGEISNFKNHYSSGHLYFTVKDNDSAIRCVMFKSSAVTLNFLPADGMSVIIRGRVSVYEKDGQYMLYAQTMQQEGEGELSKQFEITIEKLKSEGLFDEDNKRELPAFPERIALVTSETGAAVKDLINILGIRYPLCTVIMCPVLVQGADAPKSMIKTLNRVYKLSRLDLIIIGRGGGSSEDLAAFNDENLARTIFESPVPIISAVGHETDFSISDFVADKRASTPSHAAEMAVPDISELKATLLSLKKRISDISKSTYELYLSRFQNASYKVSSDKFYNYLDTKSQLLDTLFDKLLSKEKDCLNKKTASFEKSTAKLDALSPLKVLSRGFSVVKNNDVYIKSVKEIKQNDRLNIKFADGEASCLVTETKEGEIL